MSRSIMCHLVGGYPDEQACLELLHGMQALGVSAVEIQIPFSDPIADGEAIMEANDIAIESGFTTNKSFALIETARSSGFNTDIYVMSYVQKIQHFGVEAFCRRAAECHIKGLIVPDLPYDSPEFRLLLKAAHTSHLDLVPVVSPGMSQTRLRALLDFKSAAIYLTSRRGITGHKYASTQELHETASVIKKYTSATLLIGFGLASSQDVEDALRIGDVAVIGSAIVRSLQTTTLKATLTYIQSLISGQGDRRRTKII